MPKCSAWFSVFSFVFFSLSVVVVVVYCGAIAVPTVVSSRLLLVNFYIGRCFIYENEANSTVGCKSNCARAKHTHTTHASTERVKTRPNTSSVHTNAPPGNRKKRTAQSTLRWNIDKLSMKYFSTYSTADTRLKRVMITKGLKIYVHALLMSARTATCLPAHRKFHTVYRRQEEKTIRRNVCVELWRK